MTALSTSAVVGFGCAVLSALGTNLAFLYKHRGAVAAPDVEMRHPLRSAIDLFRSKWWTIGWLVAVAAFLAHVAALALLPLSLAQAVLSGGFVLLAVLAERFFGFQLGRRQLSDFAIALRESRRINVEARWKRQTAAERSGYVRPIARRAD